MAAGREIISFNYAMKYILRQRANFDILESFLEALLGYTVTILEILESKTDKDYITKSKKFMNSREEKITMCEALQKWEDQTFEKGIAEGIAEGKAEEKRNIAIAFLDLADDENIATRTGLTVDEVKQLRKDNQ